MGEVRKLYLISCVSVKRLHPIEAGNLYSSPWFLMARNLILQTKEPWFILSAKYGLLSPEMIVAPYNTTLNTMGVSERRAWANRVKQQMDDMLPDVDNITIIAGVRYRENLMAYLEDRFQSVSIPMEGMRIGQQLSWMKNATTI